MSRRQSVMSHKFSHIPSVNIPRSSFDRSHGLKTTFDSGYLVPILVDEALPGDTFNMKMTAFARLATPIKPIMDNMFMETFFFSVPVRLLWDNWQKFNGEQDSPGDSTDFLVPQFSEGFNAPHGGIFDQMGIPPGVDLPAFNALHFRAYNQIWNEWFRDENLMEPAPKNTGDGPDNPNDYITRRRGKRHDYFTSCLPWPQKSDNPVSLPLGTTAPVVPINSGIPSFDIQGLTANTLKFRQTNDPLGVVQWGVDTGNNGDGLSAKWNTPNLQTDLSNATAATINDLRLAFQTQRMFERDARGGTRYTEIIRSHFGVVSPDSRLQRPEYLGGGSTYINVAPVAQNTPSGIVPNVTPQGNLAAIGTATLNGHSFSKSFTEHCVIIGLVNVRADLTYQQGLNRMWSRQTRFDFFWPSLAHIGEQAVLNKEIYVNGDFPDAVFGYQEAFAEYRYKPSEIHGAFRSTSPEPLDYWHLSQEFDSQPTLSYTFITDRPPVDRVVAVPSEPQFLFDAHFSMRCARPMPLYGVPGMIDHF